MVMHLYSTALYPFCQLLNGAVNGFISLRCTVLAVSDANFPIQLKQPPCGVQWHQQLGAIRDKEVVGAVSDAQFSIALKWTSMRSQMASNALRYNG